MPLRKAVESRNSSSLDLDCDADDVEGEDLDGEEEEEERRETLVGAPEVEELEKSKKVKVMF